MLACFVFQGFLTKILSVAENIPLPFKLFELSNCIRDDFKAQSPLARIVLDTTGIDLGESNVRIAI